MTSLITFIKQRLAKRAHNKQAKKALTRAIAAFRSTKTATGYELPAEKVFSLDHGGEFRRVYRLGDFIIDTFQGFLGDLIIVGRVDEAASEKGLINIEDSLAVLAYTDRHFIFDDNRGVMDLLRRDDALIPFADLLTTTLQSGPTHARAAA